MTRAAPSDVADARSPSILLATVLNGHRGLTCVSATQDATLVAAGFADGAVRVWRLDGAGPESELRGHARAVYAVSWSPDQRYLLSAGGDGTIRLWDVKKRVGLCCYRAHVGPVWDVSWRCVSSLWWLPVDEGCYF